MTAAPCRVVERESLTPCVRNTSYGCVGSSTDAEVKAHVWVKVAAAQSSRAASSQGLVRWVQNQMFVPCVARSSPSFRGHGGTACSRSPNNRRSNPYWWGRRYATSSASQESPL